MDEHLIVAPGDWIRHVPDLCAEHLVGRSAAPLDNRRDLGLTLGGLCARSEACEEDEETGLRETIWHKHSPICRVGKRSGNRGVTEAWGAGQA